MVGINSPIMKKPAIPVCLVIAFALCVYAQDTNYLKIKYDKFEDRTVVFLWEMPLAQGTIGWMPEPMSPRPQVLSITLGGNFKTQRSQDARRDEDPAFVRLSSDRSIGLATPPSLTLLIDGEHVRLNTEWQTDYKGQTDDKSVKIPISYGLVRRLVAAKRVEGKLGITEFHFTTRNQDAIKAFLKAISP
jgi:hypothetical protein